LQKAKGSSMYNLVMVQDIRGNIPTVQDATKSSWKDLALTSKSGILIRTIDASSVEIRFQ